MLNNKKLAIKTSLNVLFFLAVFLSTANLTTAFATRDEFVAKPIAQVAHNGVSVSINGVAVDKVKGKTDIVSCVDLPDNSDWIPYSTIYDGSEVIQAEEMKLINYKKPETSASSHRCYHFIFPKDVTKKSIKFTIEKIQTTVPESLTQEMCNDAQNKILTTYSDFLFSCNIGDHGVGYSLIELPENMDESRAYTLVNEALTNTVLGPWKMDIFVP